MKFLSKIRDALFRKHPAEDNLSSLSEEDQKILSNIPSTFSKGEKKYILKNHKKFLKTYKNIREEELIITARQDHWLRSDDKSFKTVEEYIRYMRRLVPPNAFDIRMSNALLIWKVKRARCRYMVAYERRYQPEP